MPGENQRKPKEERWERTVVNIGCLLVSLGAENYELKRWRMNEVLY